MCGIAGFLSDPPDGAASTRILRAMADTLTHRGPDAEGFWTDPATGIGIGFRRLAILDLTATGDQPMHSSDGRFVVAFNGEIYNHQQLRRELESDGRRFRGRSDTEVIVEACSVWGAEATLPRLSGMFALALWDRQERTLLLARDPMGKKPLYYGQMGEAFLFGSELKALRAHPAFRADVDRDALALYLRYGYVPAPHTIYRGVAKLRPGQYAIVRLGQAPDLRAYWSPWQMASRGLARPLSLSDHEAVSTLDTLLRDAVARRMTADVPLGAFLSGGVDSSTVVALMQAQSERSVKTFTIGFHIPGYNEAEAAREVAHHLGTDHTELYVTAAETQAVIPMLPDLYDEPFADASQIPTYLVSRLARGQVTVSLSGDGGDELFAGYTRYRWAEKIWGSIHHVPMPLRHLAAGFIRGIPSRRWDALYRAIEGPLVPRGLRQSLPGDKLHKLAGILPSGDQDSMYDRLISLWKEPGRLVIGGTEPEAPESVRHLKEWAPGFTERMMFRDLISYLPEDILVKVDRASMAVGLEARAPLLDHRVVQWAWQLPMSLKRRNGQGKWLLRQLLYRYVPAGLIERPKTGFGVPIGPWLRGPLREWAEGLLSEDRLRREGYLRPEPVTRLWQSHLSGQGSEEYRLWAVLMFQAWRERWSA